MRKKLRVRVLAGALSASMLLGLAACGSTENKADQNTAAEPQENTTEEAVLTEADEDLADMMKVSFNLDNVMDGEKDETVYVMTDALGNKNSVVVSEWLKNSKGADTIEDQSHLTDIENVKGEETFTQDGEKITWQANGNPIYYQGKSDQEIPIGVKVSYTRDGQEVAPEKLAGAKGQVKIRFDYYNEAEDGEIYAPFLCVSGMLLDGENFSNVQVSSGKVICDGSRFIVIGLAMPGIKDNLAEETKNLDIDLPNYVEVTAQATSFSMDMTLTFATPLVFSKDAINLDADALKAKIHDKANQFENGMSTLAQGVETYTNAVNKLSGGINQISSGTQTLSSGAKKLDDGAKQVKDGASQLAEGAN